MQGNGLNLILKADLRTVNAVEFERTLTGKQLELGSRARGHSDEPPITKHKNKQP